MPKAQQRENDPAIIDARLQAIQAKRVRLADEERVLEAKKAAVLQTEAEKLFSAQERYPAVIARLTEKKVQFSQNTNSNYKAIGTALDAFLTGLNGGRVYRAGQLIPDSELDETVRLVEDALFEVERQLSLTQTTPNFTVFNEKLTAMEVKARELEDSKIRFKRKLAKTLFVVGVALAAVALGALFFGLIAPAFIPVASFAVGLVINGTFVGAGLAGTTMAKVSSVKLRDYSMPLVSQSLFALRDTMKDVKDGRNPEKVSGARKFAREIMR